MEDALRCAPLTLGAPISLSLTKHLFRTVYAYPTLRETDLEEIIAVHTPVRFGRQEYVIRPGERANAYCILETGVARSYVEDVQGREITTELFGPGQLLIEVDSLFQRTPSRTYLQSLTKAEGWKIEYADFQQLFHSLEGFREWGRAWMATQLFQLKQRTIDLHTRSATDRYRALLEQQPEIVAQAPLKHIASYLGITDTSLSRIRKEIAAGR